jgi:hypothetical protein
MLRLARRLGFDVAGEIEPGLVRVERRLDALEIGL